MWTAFLDQLGHVAHTFRANKGRSFLTLLGMIIGSGSVVLLSGLLSGGMEALLNAEQFISDADVVEIESSAPPPKQRGRTSRPLEDADQRAMDKSPSIGGAAVEGELFDWGKWARMGERKKRALVLGASDRAAKLYRVEVARGRFIDETDLRNRARVCVVGDEVWQELLGAPRSLEGVSLRVSGVRWEVVGVLKRKPPLNAGPGVWMWDRRIVVPATTFESSVRFTRNVDVLYVRLAPVPGTTLGIAERVQAAQKLLLRVLKRRHYGVENFRLGDEKGEKQQEQLIFLVINVLMMCTAGLSLFVGGVNIMNIMLVTVTERTREIGIRRALGATRGHVLRQFLLESAIIAGLGGLMGVAGGAALVFLVSQGLSALVGSWTAHYKLWAVLLGLASSTGTGIIFGLYPAWRAARLDPVEALRYE